MSERYERTSERRSEGLSTLRLNFIVILPTVDREGATSCVETRLMVQGARVSHRVDALEHPVYQNS